MRIIYLFLTLCGSLASLIAGILLFIMQDIPLYGSLIIFSSAISFVGGVFFVARSTAKK